MRFVAAASHRAIVGCLLALCIMGAEGLQAQGDPQPTVTVTFSPGTLAPVAGQTASLNIVVKIPKVGTVHWRPPDFDVSVHPADGLTLEWTGSTGHIKPSNPNDRVPKTFHFDVDPNNAPAVFQGTVTYTVRLQAGVNPGTITASVGGQQQLTLLGVQGSQGQGNFSGSGQLVIAQQAGAPPPPQDGTSGPTTTPGVTNPGASPYVRPTIIGLAVLMALAGLPWLYRRLFGGAAPPLAPQPAPPFIPPVTAAPPPMPAASRRPAPAPPPAPPPAPQPPPPAPAARQSPPATPPPQPKPAQQKPPEAQSTPGLPIPPHLLRPDLVAGAPVVYPRQLKPDPSPLGNRQPPEPPRPPLDVEIFASPDEIRADGTRTIRLFARLKPGSPPGTVIIGTGFYCSTMPLHINSTGPDSAECHVTWQWTTPDKPLVFNASVNVQMPGQPILRIPPQHPAVVQIKGADPKLRVTRSKPDLFGVGNDSTEITATLELFGEPVGPLEQVEIFRVTARLRGRDWKHFTPIKDPAAPGRRVLWTAPFLMARPGQSRSEAAIAVMARWHAGPMYNRAAKPVPILEGRVAVGVLGCHVRSNPEPPTFLPLPGFVLQTEACLTRNDGGPMTNPFVQGMVRAPEAGIACQVEDRTQGRIPPRAPHGCSIPPEPPTQGTTRMLPPASISETGKIWTPRNPVRDPRDALAASFAARGKDHLLLHLGEYTPQTGFDPIHGCPYISRIIVQDGMGDGVTTEAISRVALEVLDLQTTGLQVPPVLEHEPHTFEVALTSTSEHSPLLHQQTWELFWEFAIMDEQGQQPLASAGRVRTLPTPMPPTSRMRLTVGHWHPGSPADGRDIHGTVVEPRVLPEREHLLSLVLRRRWHELAAQARLGHDCEALPWARTPRADGGWNDSPWKDRVLHMALRVELRAEGKHLLASSDLAYTDTAPPPSQVWRRNVFRYALCKVRLHLQDVCGRLVPNRPWRFTTQAPDIQAKLPLVQDRVDADTFQLASTKFAMPPVPGDSRNQGLLEVLMAPGSEKATLAFLASPGSIPDEPWCELQLDLGGLPPVKDDEGVRARLENLGLHPGPQASGEQFTRALRKFQVLAGLPADGDPNDTTRARLEEADRMANLTDGLPRP